MTETENEIEGIIVEDETDGDLALRDGSSVEKRDTRPLSLAKKTYLTIPMIFLAVTLLGGLRLGGADNAFIFIRPALICLVFAAILMTLFFRSGLLVPDGWFSDEFSGVQNVANGMVV